LAVFVRITTGRHNGEAIDSEPYFVDLENGKINTVPPDDASVVLRLGVFIGLEFEERMWGKRPIRALRQGVIAFGEDNLPVPIHGRNRADASQSASTWRGEQAAQDHTHSAPACCRGPWDDAGTRGGARGRIDRTDESNSGLEQTHQGTNVGATGLEPATS
jgi:hypothetical protein